MLAVFPFMVNLHLIREPSVLGKSKITFDFNLQNSLDGVYVICNPQHHSILQGLSTMSHKQEHMFIHHHCRWGPATWTRIGYQLSTNCVF